MTTANKQILQALVEAMIFFEFSGDLEINPDTAVRILENIAFRFHGLQTIERAQLRADLLAIAADYNEPQRKFIMTLGLGDDYWANVS
jgi:hypothetical protein